MFCQQCGAQNSTGARFCGRCGATLTAGAPPPPPPPTGKPVESPRMPFPPPTPNYGTQPPLQAYGMQQPSPIYGAPPVPYATFLERVGALLLDNLILLVGDMIILGIFAILGGIITAASRNNAGAGAAVFLGLIGYVLVIVFTLGYFAYFNSSERQATPGMRIVGIKVTTVNGDRLSLGHALVRHLALILGMSLCYAGPLVMLFTEKKQALHDLMCGTLVVSAK
jgi:uncharacterized RDD family membrane protein YckC